MACAIKVMHKDVVYRHPDGRSAVRSEEKALQRVTMSGVKFLTDVWGTWDDEDNVYFAMVSEMCTFGFSLGMSESYMGI